MQIPIKVELNFALQHQLELFVQKMELSRCSKDGLERDPEVE